MVSSMHAEVPAPEMETTMPNADRPAKRRGDGFSKSHVHHGRLSADRAESDGCVWGRCALAHTTSAPMEMAVHGGSGGFQDD